MSDGRESGGLFAALRNVAATLLASGKTRLELLGNELEEQKLHVIRLFLLFQGLVLCLGVTVLLVVALITAVFWDSRVLVLGVFVGIFFVLCGVFYAMVRRAMQRPEKIFSASIAELEEDLRQLKAAAGYEPPAK